MSFAESCLCFALVGIGASAMWGPVLTITQRWFSLKRRGMALGILSTGFGLGFGLTGKLFPIIVEQWSWRYCWYAMGVAALFMILLNGVLLRSKPEDMGLCPWGGGSGIGPVPQVLEEDRERAGRYSEMLQAPRFWMIGFSYLLSAATLYGVTTYMVDYARYNLEFSYEKASSLATVHGVSQIVGVLVILPFSDYLGRRLTLIASNLILSLSLAGLIVSGRNEIGLWISIAVFGAFYGITFPMYGACGGDYFRKEIIGSVIGAWTPFYGLGAIGSHRLTGYLRDTTGSFFAPFLIMILGTLGASMLMFFMRYPPGGKGRLGIDRS